LSKKIAVFTGNRAEYGLLHPVIRSLASDSSMETYLIISGSHLSDEFGMTVSEIDASSTKEVKEIPLPIVKVNENEGMLLSFSAIINNGLEILKKWEPDMIVLAGDRFETFAMAVTSFYMNIPIAHLFGGDLSQGGHLDDSARHSITKLAHLHFTTNEDSYKRVIALGEEKWRVFNVGSPVMDNVVKGDYSSPDEIARELELEIDKPIILFTQHPITTESELAYDQVKESLEAMKELGYQTIITYPCNDSGSKRIIEAIREYSGIPNFRIRKSLGRRLYLGCLKIVSCVVGNSSSGLIETPIFKVPAVNIGDRQAGRLKAENVIDVPCKREAITKAIRQTIEDYHFIAKARNCSNPYGEGGASKQILDVIKSTNINSILLKKKMTF
jgi:GDP/UDP-N,N'-diacetylbacillosamine 2-epimerase (hydrolysing)